MIQQIAKRRILEWFPEGVNPSKTYKDISEDEYLEVFKSIKKLIPFKKPSQNLSLMLFLYAACLKFDRWLAPTPAVLPPNFIDIYKSFVTALIRAEGGESDNSKILRLRIIKNDIFDKFDSISLDKIPDDEIDAFIQKIEAISPPNQNSKIQEFHEEYAKVSNILEGLTNKTLRTKIVTRIPYTLHLRPISVELIWSGIPVFAKFEPTFYDHPSTFTVYKPASQPEGPARWQSGITTIELYCKALVNTDKEVPSLLSCPSKESLFTGWSKEFEFLFGIIHDLSWQIRLYHGGEKQWVPAPRDILEAEVEIFTPGKQRLFWKLKGSPGVLTKAFHPDTTVLTLNLGEIDSPDWHTR